MSSVIAPMPSDKLCKGCGVKLAPKVIDDYLEISVYSCPTCGSHPKQIKLRRSLPIGENGKSERVDILFNRMGKRITSIHEALHIARSIDYDLKDGRFNPDDYKSKAANKAYFFKNLISGKYIPYLEVKFGIGDFENKQVSINHLLKFFGEMDVRKIRPVTINEYQLNYKCGARSKDLSIQELGVILKYFKKIGKLTHLPELPETSQSRERSLKEIISKEDQVKVISKIDDEYYRGMIEILAIYALRPGDLRAIKWNDLDFNERTIRINEHFAKNKIKSGRKSTEDELNLPMTERFLEIISNLPRSINGNDYVFKSKDSIGRFTKGPVGEARLRIHWNRAIAKAKVKKVSLYVGTKSASLTSLLNGGNSAEDMLALTGHTSVKTLKRYAKESEENKLKKVKNILSKVSKKGSSVG